METPNARRSQFVASSLIKLMTSHPTPRQVVPYLCIKTRSMADRTHTNPIIHCSDCDSQTQISIEGQSTVFTCIEECLRATIRQNQGNLIGVGSISLLHE